MAYERVLVTGGAGFIGSHLVGDLLETGAEVVAVDNEFTGAASLLPAGVRFEPLDLLDEEFHDFIEEFNPEAIVHLAAIHYVPYCNAHPEEAFRVNVMGTRNLLEAAREIPALERLVFTSSAAVYPPRDDAHRERDPPGPMDVYGETKLIGEDLVQLFATETGVPTAAARVFNVYGPNDTNAHLIPAIMTQVRDGDRRIELGNLTPARDFIHVSDVSSALLALLEDNNEGHETYNVGTGTERSVQEVVELTSTALGEELEIVQRDERIRESDRPHLRADATKLREELDWAPAIEFVDGLRDLLEADEVLVE